jgi:2-polyprenyl-3-methyl-5-hydroxy-6-metoxy-1,4-benzoquinol methylase
MSEEQPNRPPDHRMLAEFWDQWIERNVRPDYPDNVRRGQTVLELLKSLDLRNPDILDVGCANGWLSDKLASFGTVTGIDFAEQAIAAAKTRYPHVRFICQDFLTSDLPSGDFDVVVSVGVLQGVRDQAMFIDRLAATLRPQGYLILISANKFVWDHIRSGGRPADDVPCKFLYMRELKDLIGRRFAVRHAETIIPGGDLGFLRLINSEKAERVLGKVLNPHRFMKMKERAGLGKSLVVLAQKAVSVQPSTEI